MEPPTVMLPTAPAANAPDRSPPTLMLLTVPRMLTLAAKLPAEVIEPMVGALNTSPVASLPVNDPTFSDLMAGVEVMLVSVAVPMFSVDALSLTNPPIVIDAPLDAARSSRPRAPAVVRLPVRVADGAETDLTLPSLVTFPIDAVPSPPEVETASVVEAFVPVKAMSEAETPVPATVTRPPASVEVRPPPAKLTVAVPAPLSDTVVTVPSASVKLTDLAFPLPTLTGSAVCAGNVPETLWPWESVAVTVIVAWPVTWP